MNPDELEVVPGFAHEELQGTVWAAETEEDLRTGLEKAFDYRGDITVTLRDGRVVEGYLFDRRSAVTLHDSLIRLMAKNGGAKTTVRYSEVAALAFTGRDTAAGKSWEAWVKRYFEKKAAGETNIEIEPERLD